MGIVRRLFLFVILVFSFSVYAQEATLQDRYKEFVEKARSAYNSHKEDNIKSYRAFRDEMNVKYADFISLAWTLYKSKPAIPIPYEEPVVPPQPIPDTFLVSLPQQPIPLPHDVVVDTPQPIEQPKPIAPIYEDAQSRENWFNFVFYGTNCKVRIDDRHRFTLASIDESSIAQQWSDCCSGFFDNLIRDCLALRLSLNLCDYAYLQMLDALSDQYFGKDTNESVFLMSFLYCQSGYKMRFGKSGNNRLVMFFSSRHTIFRQSYYEIDGEKFYAYNATDEDCYISSASYENEQPMSLIINYLPRFEMQTTDARKIYSHRFPDISLAVTVNKNLIDFYNTYPVSQYSNDKMTQWAIYANTPVSDVVKQTLYIPMKQKLEGLSQVDAVSRILNWVQTGLEYRVDKEVWGTERAFFMDETLYYPYCDCEDRAILFARMVRDLLGLEAVLVYYPNHLATAIEFTDAVSGDYFDFDGRKFVVCDPTYIGASIGMTMPRMNNVTAKLIKLK